MHCSAGNRLSFVATRHYLFYQEQKREAISAAKDLHVQLTHTHKILEKAQDSSRSSMLSIALPLLALICGAFAEGEDKKCFTDEFGSTLNITSNTTSSFDIRIEHSGSVFNVGDWFDSGDVHTINAGDIYEYNTTAKAMSEICTMVEAFHGDWCEGEMYEIGKIQRYLYVGFDGENLMLAMRKMNVTLTKDGATATWDKCFTMKQTADSSMNVVEITYVDWDTSAITDGLPDWWNPEDKLLVSGSASTIVSIVTLVSLIVATRVF